MNFILFSEIDGDQFINTTWKRSAMTAFDVVNRYMQNFRLLYIDIASMSAI